MHSQSPAAVVAALVWLAAAATAQKDAPAEALEGQLATRAVGLLTSFAKTCDTNKLPSRARTAWQLVVDGYDPQHQAARTALGHRLVGDTWQTGGPAPAGADAATPKQRAAVDAAWRSTAKQLAKLHRDLGMQLWKTDEEAGRRHLERSLDYEPDDARTHQTLGHEEVNGFRGNAAQIAFVRRFLAIRAKANEIAEQPFEIQDLPPDAMPRELQATRLPFVGAKSPHFTYWVNDAPEAARASALWAERGYTLWQFLFGVEAASRVRPPLQWHAIVRTETQRDVLLQQESLRGKMSAEEARAFSGNTIQVRGGEAAWQIHDAALDADKAVAAATNHGCRRVNPALLQGCVHAATWLLCGTTHSRYGSLPKTYAGTFELPKSDPAVWFDRLQEMLANDTAVPLVQVPRERLDAFREDVRIQAWSFQLWLLARHPDDWPVLVQKLNQSELLPEQVEAAFVAALERPLAAVEAEWRAWAEAGSRIGKATRFR